MPVMVQNDLLERAAKNPSILTPEEVGAVITETLRGRKFIARMVNHLETNIAKETR